MSQIIYCLTSIFLFAAYCSCVTVVLSEDANILEILPGIYRSGLGMSMISSTPKLVILFKIGGLETESFASESDTFSFFPPQQKSITLDKKDMKQGRATKSIVSKAQNKSPVLFYKIKLSSHTYFFTFLLHDDIIIYLKHTYD